MITSIPLASMPTTERSVFDPVPRLILAVDVEGSTRRTGLIKGELRRDMYALLERALRATGIDHKHLEKPIDRGDGVLLLFRPHDDVPKTLLLGQLIPTLAALLAERNATAAEPTLRLRLRVVLHAGEVHDDGWGFYGEDLDVAFRLLYSPSVKKALRNAPRDSLALVVSEEIYSGIVRGGYVDVGPYIQAINVLVRGWRRRGRVFIPSLEPAVSAPAPFQYLASLAPPLRASPAVPEAPWEPDLLAACQAVEQHMDETDEPYDTEAGLAKLKNWMSTRQRPERAPADARVEIAAGM